jgi:outer membrane receptor protein involved in Fe transport
MQDMTRMLRYLFVLLFVSVAGSAFGQTGAISGTVFDERKEPIIGAIVQVFQSGTARGGDQTNEDGKFTVKPLQPGSNYEIRVNYVGYRQVVLKNVIISPDRTTYQNFNLELATNLQEVVVKEYKVPLIKRDEPGSTTTFTTEQIAKIPTRNTSDVASLAAGTYQEKSGGQIQIAGARPGGTLYVIDGVQVSGTAGTNFPPGAIEQMSVITSGVPARYGDASGGVINITTRGGAPKHTGEVGYERSVDGYGRNYAYFSVAGPLLKKKDSLNRRNILGYSLSGNYSNIADDDPNYFSNYVLKGDKLREIQQNPLREVTDITGRKTPRSQAEFIRMSDLETSKRRVNADYQNARVVGKVDYQLSDNVSVVLGGNFTYAKSRNYDRRFTLFSPDAMPNRIDYTGRGFVRLTQRFGKSNFDPQAKESKTPLISNAFYSIQADYQASHTDVSDPNHGHNPFYYGYVGKFDIETQTVYGVGNDDSIDRPGTVLLAYDAPVRVNFTRSERNPLLANYTSQYYNIMGSEFYPRTLNDIQVGRGLLNGQQPDVVYTDWTNSPLFYNVGHNLAGYSYNNEEQFAFSADASFDFQPKKTKHSIEFGLYYQQRAERSYNMTRAISSGQNIWSLMRTLANRHILNLDKTEPIYVINGREYTLEEYRNSGIAFGPYDTVRYQRLVDDPLQTTFDRNLRSKLGLDVNGRDYINIDGIDPSVFSLDMFSPDELINTGVDIANWYGYDYTGKRINGQVNFNDWFTKKDANGNYTRNLGAFRPNYVAGYIQDKFELPNNVLFNVGLRVERFDANTKVLKDPYTLYAAHTVATATDATNPGGTPSNIGSNYTVYVKDNSVEKPIIVAYRNGDDWYDASGKFLDDPTRLNAVVGGDPQPYLVKNSSDGKRALTMRDEGYDPNTSFTDYKPQVNVMPRINFTFPIAEQSMFYAHYDVYVMRPKSAAEIYVSPVDYYYLNQKASEILSNPNLKPEKVFDYELGFQQVLTQNSSVTINGFYKERKDMIQYRRMFYAWPNTYQTLDNRDFMTYKGFSLKYDLRRVNHLQLQLSYTLQFAEGTGVSSTSGQTMLNNLLGFAQPNVRFAFPLNNDSRHVLNANVDYRYDKGEGPVIGNTHILENAGLNLVFRARSGEPFTRYQFAGQRVIVGGVQGSRLPWHYMMDLRIDKSIPLSFGKKAGSDAQASRLGLMAFVYVQNLLNTRDVLRVHGATGRPDNDGWVASPAGVQEASVKSDPKSYQELYLLYNQVPGFLNNPRRINLGISLTF